MSKREKLVFVTVFVGVLAVITIAYALTTEQVFNSWFDGDNDAIRINVVASES